MTNEFEITIIKGKNRIKTLDDWFNLAPPEGKESQWVDKHSAKELARYFTDNPKNMPKEIEKILVEKGINDNYFECEPEAQTSLCKEGFGQGPARHHDMLMVGEKIVIGVEAKATEVLDDYVTDKYKNTKNHDLRYKGLCKEVLDSDIEDCSSIRYQLLSATMGTIIEAKQRNIKKAILLIIIFSSDLTSNQHINNTINDVNNFKNKLIKNDGHYRIPFDLTIEFDVELVTIPLVK